jgi:DNA-binding NarL/FixJ family response regulator
MDVARQPNRLRLIIADDHRVVRQGLVALLSRENDLEIVGEAGSGREALSMAVEHEPDVVIMDVSMRDMDGVQATLEIKRERPRVHVIALSMFREKALADQMLKAGADAYVHKGGPIEELISAVRNCTGH